MCEHAAGTRAPRGPPAGASRPLAGGDSQAQCGFFLERAEEAQRRGFLTQPAGASAYDYYLRVRHLDPDNSRAASGIQTIVIEFVERARDALRRRAFGEVNTSLNRAEELAPGNPLVAEVRAQLLRERSRAKLDLPQGRRCHSRPHRWRPGPVKSWSCCAVLPSVSAAES
ncbi:hypothetical protein [Microbulbifer taiwanensis]|uniref:hypothetical protein n=1 Tax=Microbulbifer taiwanensis TaxID=986746 RepID=UPI00360BB768